ncbi:imidazole glycerol phosphate synthase subunit HisH [Sphingobacterium hungaricum]|uniref:Imidazole glycerol phosphate synthase subunit HisH n=1 Tax=Sphingobacterium hungaricum TaxID=2082723 RepID=A0A928UUH6_9SPHI|nr:imidazole glycerol phosphate synthase subunit HisH [Sphingobacterium hungaricum]MBE8713455.1 imidazole glycerol phosphate synthase subunit HisH [Sphingobacterium hungaricum]
MIGIVNYGAGNIFSLTATLERLNIPFGMINQEADFDKYERIIIPGVGHAAVAMKKLEDSGLADAIKTLTKPVLGICVGMQLLTSFSEEGNAPMLNHFPLKTLHFANRIDLKIPHVGWNSVELENDCPIFKEISNNAYFYFVHSYFIEFDNSFTSASCDYGVKFSAAIWKNNFYAVQFHPEKSGRDGEQLLLNFSKI